MNTYIALLRGINVGGHRKIKMADLRILLEDLNFSNVTTYIQSGNIVFKSELTISSCEGVLKKAIKESFDLIVPVLVLGIADLEKILKVYPFSKFKQIDSYYTLLSNFPEAENILQFESITYPDEELELIEKCVYFYTSKGMGKAKYSNNLAENKLKVEATTRNHRTLTKLFELSKDI